MTIDATPQYRAPLHVRIYLWIALLLFSIVPAMWISGVIYDENHVYQGATAFVALFVVIQILFWFAQRRCSSESLTAGDGLRYITAYMTIGVGSYSLFVAVPCAICAIALTCGIALLSMFDAAPGVAQKRFASMVQWFSRHRMYQ